MTNWFFLHFQPLYKFLYFQYKIISDRAEIIWVQKRLKKSMVAIDIGANIGFYTILLSKIVGENGKVYSFEPDDVNFHFLKNNVERYKNVILKNLAASNKNGFIQLYLSKNLNVDHRTYKTEDSRVVKKVKCVTLDKFFKHNKQIDFIKIDVQGYDFFVMQGAQEMIKRQKKIAIVGEFWPYGLKRAGVKPQDYIRLLKSLNLKVIINTKKPLAELENNKKYYTNFFAYK
jgi:FkbM family methyltransferase